MSNEEQVKPKSVDEYLDEVDYRALNKYVPSKFAIEFIEFCKLISVDEDGKNELQSTPAFHYKMIDTINSENRRIVNLCHRGSAKTTLFGEFLILYVASFGKLPHLGKIHCAIFVADSAEGGAATLRDNIEARYRKSPALQALIPKVNFTDKQIEFENSRGHKFGVKLYGAKSQIRGVKLYGQRPKLAIIDDIIKDKEATSEASLNAIRETIHNAVPYALDPRVHKIVFNGTPFNKRDPIYEVVESGVWDVNVYPVCNKFPCTEEEFVGSWAERFSYAHVLDQYKSSKALHRSAKGFNQELMLRISTDDDKLLSTSDYSYFDLRDINRNSEDFNFVITTDFAVTTKASSDYTVILVWALDCNKNRFLVDGICKRQTLDRTFNDLFNFVEKYQPMAVGIERSGTQVGFIDLFRQEMNRREVWFNIAPGKGSKQPGISVSMDKMSRFNLVIPFFRAGKIKFPTRGLNTELENELFEELGLATHDGFKSKHDDVADAISQLEQFVMPYPSQISGAEEKSLKPVSGASTPFDVWVDDSFDINLTGYSSYLGL